MSLFSDDTIERVREAADMVDIVSAYTDLRHAGAKHVGLCPFHEERTPSFSIDAREKLYYCFGCEAGGDVFKFVQEKEGLSFPDAVEALADRFGVEIEREQEDPQAEARRRRRVRLWEALSRTAAFYEGYLWESPKAAKAREYLAGRGLGEEVLRSFGVGFAPSEWGTVLARGQQAGYTIEDLKAAGLIRRGQKGGMYDWFRGRITFPIRDSRGRVQGFGARGLTADATPKYVNSPDGELYHKGSTLFGIDKARAEIGRAGRAVVVEGYTDVLALHQAGIEEAVAVMGTAITPEQLRELASHADEVVLAMDADRAGREAMLRAQRTAGSGGRSSRQIRMRVASMTAGEDPADALLRGSDAERAASAERFRELIEKSVEMPVFHIRSVLDEADLATPGGRDRGLDEVVPVLVGMGGTISQEELVREVADRLNTDPALVRRRMADGPGVANQQPPTDSSAEAAQPKIDAPRRLTAQEHRERALLAMCIKDPERGQAYLQQLTEAHLSSPLLLRARDWLVQHLRAPIDGLPREDDELWSVVTGVYLRSEHEPSSEEAMRINFNELEIGVIDAKIEAIRKDGGSPPVELQRQRAELAEQIAHGPAAAR